MRLQALSQIPDDGRVREDWNRLVLAMESPQVFYTYEWALAVSRAYQSVMPSLFIAYRGKSVAGIAALAIDETRSEVFFLAGFTADYCDFVSAPADRKELIELVLNELRKRRLKTLRLENLPADSVSATILRSSAGAYGLAAFERPAYFCPQIPLETAEQRAQIAQSAHRSLKKGRNVAARMGGAAVAHIKDYDEFAAEFPEYAVASVARFLATPQASVLLPRERRDFMMRLAELLSKQGWLTFSTFRLNGKSVAWHFGFQFAGSWFSYLPAFENLPKLHPGPGAYLLCEILRQASEDPEMRVVDLGLGDEAYKQQYVQNGRRTLYFVSSRSRLRLAREVCCYRAARFVKRFPRAESAIRSAIHQSSVLRARVAQHGLISQVYRHLAQLVRPAKLVFLEAESVSLQSLRSLTVQPLSTKLLARAAMNHCEDSECLDYVRRSAARLKTGADAFTVVGGDGSPVHICWAVPFERLSAPLIGCESGDAVLLVNSWTSPEKSENSEQYSALISAQLPRLGRRPWVCAEEKVAPRFEGVGFVRRFSRASRRPLFKEELEMRPNDSAERLIRLHPAA